MYFKEIIMNRKICQVNFKLKIVNPENLSVFFVNLIIEQFLRYSHRLND